MNESTSAHRFAFGILIVDDHPLARLGIAALIQDQPDLRVIGEADDPSEGLRLFEALKPDLTIADLTLRNGSGISLIRRIKALDTHANILVLSMHPEFMFAEYVLRLGAMGYVNKEEASDKLLDAIRQVIAGRTYVSSHIADRVLHDAGNRYRDSHSAREVEQSFADMLTERELEVFTLLGRGQATRDIADHLHLSPKTVESHRESIKRKLRLENAAQLTCRATAWVLAETQ